MIVDTDKPIKSGTIAFVADENSERSVKGSLSLVGSVDRSVSPPKFTVTGLIETTARLPDHMVEVRAGRLIVFDVLIQSLLVLTIIRSCINLVPRIIRF